MEKCIVSLNSKTLSLRKKECLKCVACWSVVLFVLYQGCCNSIYLPVEEQHYNKYLVPLYRKGGTNIPQLKVF